MGFSACHRRYFGCSRRGTRYSSPMHGRIAVACRMAVHRNVVFHPYAWINAPPAAADPDHPTPVTRSTALHLARLRLCTWSMRMPFRRNFGLFINAVRTAYTGTMTKVLPHSSVSRASTKRRLTPSTLNRIYNWILPMRIEARRAIDTNAAVPRGATAQIPLTAMGDRPTFSRKKIGKNLMVIPLARPLMMSPTAMSVGIIILRLAIHSWPAGLDVVSLIDSTWGFTHPSRLVCGPGMLVSRACTVEVLFSSGAFSCSAALASRRCAVPESSWCASLAWCSVQLSRKNRSSTAAMTEIPSPTSTTVRISHRRHALPTL
eukprot:m.33868 g.33868  ORF g.33868 m.33868 type:complete len:318 (+) comp14265_c0_seq1:51-1004(+)